jgi:transposase InsO family protein
MVPKSSSITAIVEYNIGTMLMSRLLNKNRIKISMSEKGDPLENAIAERVNGILKDELLENGYTAASCKLNRLYSMQ